MVEWARNMPCGSKENIELVVSLAAPSSESLSNCLQM